MVKRRLKQRYLNVYNVYTTLFQRRLTKMCPLGRHSEAKIIINSKRTTS